MTTFTTVAAGNPWTDGSWDAPPDWTGAGHIYQVRHAMTQTGPGTVGADGLVTTMQVIVDRTSGRSGSWNTNGYKLINRCSWEFWDSEFVLTDAGNFAGDGLISDSASGKEWRFQFSPAGGAGSVSNFKVAGSIKSWIFHRKSASGESGCLGSGGPIHVMRATNTTASTMGLDCFMGTGKDIGNGTASYTNYGLEACPAPGSSQKCRLESIDLDDYGALNCAAMPANTNLRLKNLHGQWGKVAESGLDWFFSITAASTGERIWENIGLPQSSFALSGSWTGFTVFCVNLSRYIAAGATGTPTVFDYILTWRHNNGGFATCSFVGTRSHLGNVVSLDGDATDAGCSWGPGGLAGSSGEQKFDNWFIQNITKNGYGTDGICPQLPSNGPYTYYATRGIIILGPEGLSSSGLTSNHSNKFTFIKLDFCQGVVATSVQGVICTNVDAGYPAHPGMLNGPRNSLLGAPTPRSGPAMAVSCFGNSSFRTSNPALDQRFASAAGSTGTNIKGTSKTFQTTVNADWASSQGGLVVVTVGPTDTVLGERRAVTGNGSGDVTVVSTFTGTNFVGATFALAVTDQIVRGSYDYNVLYNADRTGDAYDPDSRNRTDGDGTDGFCWTDKSEIGPHNTYLGTGNGWSAASGLGYMFRHDEMIEIGWDITTMDRVLGPLGKGVGLDPTWQSGVSALRGQFVSCANAGFYGGRDTNYQYTVDHTTSSSTRPGDNAQTWRTKARIAAEARIARLTADGTLFTDPAMWADGDSLLPCKDRRCIPYIFDRLRTGRMPTSPFVINAGENGVTPGPVKYVPLPKPSSGSIALRRARLFH